MGETVKLHYGFKYKLWSWIDKILWTDKKVFYFWHFKNHVMMTTATTQREVIFQASFPLKDAKQLLNGLESEISLIENFTAERNRDLNGNECELGIGKGKS